MTAKKTEFIVTDLISKIFQRKTIMDKLPSQRELAEIYHVSRFTIQKVLGRLQSIGLIYMTQGDGTYINKKALGHPMVYNSLTEVPYEELRSRTLYLKQVEPTAELRRVFNLEAGETLWEFRRIRIVRYEISQVETGWMPCALFPELNREGDEGKISSALARLMEEDPTLSYENNAETHQQVIGGLGEQHLDVVKAKLKNKFGVEIGLEAPRIAYRESIRKACQKQGRHKKQTGGHGQFGDVIINFEPCDSEQVVFEEKVFGGSVPKNFFPAVEKGVRLAAEKGVLAGYPVVGLKATLLDGSYHPVDSSEMAFIMAAKLAYKAAMPEAGPVILEPIHTLKAHVPNDNTGDIMGDVTKRRGRVLGMEPDEDGLQTIIAEVPLAELANFTTFIRQTTQGRGWFTTEFARYEVLPEMLVPAVVEQAKKLGNLDESADD